MDQAERLRQLVKTSTYNNSNKKIHDNIRIITIASGKGGVGKTNVVTNLAIQLQKLGNKVIIIDADFGFANIDVVLGVVPKYNFLDLINKKMDITEILTEGPYGVKFISGASEIKQLLYFTNEQLQHFINNFVKLSDIADIILIDTGAGITDSALNFMSASNDVIVITTPEPTAITDAYILLKTIKNQDFMDDQNIKLRMIINLVENYREGEEIFNKISKVTKKFLEIEILKLGYIPFDKHLMSAVKIQTPVSICYPKSKVVNSIEDMARFLLKADNGNCNQSRGIQSFINSLLSRKVNR